jgi:hypothetical protein
MNRPIPNALPAVACLALSLFASTAHPDAKKRATDIVLDSWSLTESIAVWKDQSCASLLRTLLKERGYAIVSADPMIDENRAHIFYTLAQPVGKGVAIVKCGEPEIQ